jgi:hypothetical protein
MVETSNGGVKSDGGAEGMKKLPSLTTNGHGRNRHGKRPRQRQGGYQ